MPIAPGLQPGAPDPAAAEAPFRLAVYYLPPARSALWRAGTAALGYSCRLGAAVGRPGGGAPPRPAGDGSAPRLRSRAALYGFHATMAAPFRAAAGGRGIDRGLEAILASARPVRMPRMRLVLMRDSFPALVPEGAAEGLGALERALVEGLRPCAEAPDEECIRRRGHLTARQRAYAEAWGYPYVLEEFRFHMSLGDFPDRRFLEELSAAFTPEALAPFVMDTLCLCAQPSPSAPFRLIREIPLGGS
jgi:hypothetical protein